jgi:ATP-binding cassette subfamily B (MDR/TAP) protein 1
MLAPYSVDFTRASVAAAKLFDLIDRNSEIDSFDPTGEIPSGTIGEITLDNVTFAYPTRPGVTVLNNYSVNFPAGKTTALVVSSYSTHMETCLTVFCTGSIWIWKKHYYWSS